MTLEEIDSLLAGRTISDVRPWSFGKPRKVDNWCRALCETIASEKRLGFRLEPNDIDGAVASYVSAWFHRPDRVQRTKAGNETTHLIVNVCRFAPVFCFGEGRTHVAPRNSATFEYQIDHFGPTDTGRLALDLQPVLESHGLQRLLRKRLAVHLPDGVDTARLGGTPPFTEFDAYFHIRG